MYLRFFLRLAPLVWCACLVGTAHAGELRLGFSQEFGRDGHITGRGRSSSDVYSESAVSVGLDHPAVFLDHKLSLNPVLGLSYTKYLELDQLDTFGFDISGPLSLQLDGLGDGADSVVASANIKRDTGAVSNANSEQATSTTLGASALYTHYWGSPRWKSELGYTYGQKLYDDAALRDRDSTTHTLSAAMLYALNREVDVGARTSYAREEFDGGTRLSSDTWNVEGLVRWQVTSKVKSELALGHETAFYQDRGSESGMTVRGGLEYQVTPRWNCSGALAHQLEPSDQAGSTGATTTTGNIKVAYRFTSKLTGAVLPRMVSQTGNNGDQVNEFSFAVEATYAFRMVDLTVMTGGTDRSSDRGGDDTYRAVDAAVRVEWGSGRGAGRSEGQR